MSDAITLAALSACLGCGATAPMQPTSAVPTASTGALDGMLAIRDFSVTGQAGEGGGFSYLPRLTLVETKGRGDVSIVEIAFELLDVGPAGRAGPYRRTILVPAGGTVVLDEVNGYPWLEITSQHAEASRVSVVVLYVLAGTRHSDSVSAVAQVSR